ncbi:MAG: hypothetical protein RML94_02925 [Bacteroidia bacterium]|nr:hypothetical protein [Bacteroidia bacterium]
MGVSLRCARVGVLRANGAAPTPLGKGLSMGREFRTVLKHADLVDMTTNETPIRKHPKINLIYQKFKK